MFSIVPKIIHFFCWITEYLVRFMFLYVVACFTTAIVVYKDMKPKFKYNRFRR